MNKKIKNYNTIIKSKLQGEETTANAMSFALLMMAMHKNVQEKIVDELHSIFPSIDDEVDFNSVNKLTYMEMVIKETMRLFPASTVLLRKASKDFQMGEYTIPAGTNIQISFFKVQRDKKYWGDDADSFVPERFEPEKFKNVPQYACFPFSSEFY